ncbi:MAG: 4Fe-4S dicluster domain-containing protein [Firmicutes bacterium]|nr:4Fe-4S dicluster domain-containing protein [Bacillota bacterium]
MPCGDSGAGAAGTAFPDCTECGRCAAHCPQSLSGR